MYACLAVKVGEYETIAATRIHVEGGFFVVHEDLEPESESEADLHRVEVHRTPLAALPPTIVYASY